MLLYPSFDVYTKDYNFKFSLYHTNIKKNTSGDDDINVGKGLEKEGEKF